MIAKFPIQSFRSKIAKKQPQYWPENWTEPIELPPSCSSCPNPDGTPRNLDALCPRLADERDRLAQHGEGQAQQDELGHLPGERPAALHSDSFLHFDPISPSFAESFGLIPPTIRAARPYARSWQLFKARQGPWVFRGYSYSLCQSVPFVQSCLPSTLLSPYNKGYLFIWTEYQANACPRLSLVSRDIRQARTRTSLLTVVRYSHILAWNMNIVFLVM